MFEVKNSLVWPPFDIPKREKNPVHPTALAGKVKQWVLKEKRAGNCHLTGIALTFE